jgi:hypothetical protein
MVAASVALGSSSQEWREQQGRPGNADGGERTGGRRRGARIEIDDGAGKTAGDRIAATEAAAAILAAPRPMSSSIGIEMRSRRLAARVWATEIDSTKAHDRDDQRRHGEQCWITYRD